MGAWVDDVEPESSPISVAEAPLHPGGVDATGLERQAEDSMAGYASRSGPAAGGASPAIDEVFRPTLNTPSQVMVSRLVSEPSEMLAAPPLDRLAALYYQIAVLEQQQWAKEMSGTAWMCGEPQLIAPGSSTQSWMGGMDAPGNGTAIWEALYQMR